MTMVQFQKMMFILCFAPVITVFVKTALISSISVYVFASILEICICNLQGWYSLEFMQEFPGLQRGPYQAQWFATEWICNL